MEKLRMHIMETAVIEAGLAKSDELFAEFQKLAHAGIYEWDLVANKIFCSVELLNLFGIEKSSSKLYFSDLLEVVHQEDTDLCKNQITDAVMSGSPLSCEFRITRADKSEKFLCVKGKLFFTTKGDPIRLLGTVFDITERKWAEEELNNKNIAVLNAYKKLEHSQLELKQLNNELEKRVEERTLALKKSESELRTLSETIPHLVWRADAEGNYDYFNKQWYDYTGLSYKDSYKQNWKSAVHPEDIDKVMELWSQSVKTGNEFSSEYKLRHHSGNYRWFLSRALPIIDTDGEILKWFGTSTDIHDQRLINEKKDEFISIASHELKTPLTSIKAYIQLLTKSDSFNKDKVAQLYLEKTNAFINKLNTLIAELLDVSKIQAGKLQFNMSSFRFDELVKESVETMQNITSTHKIIITGSCDANVVGDKHRLEQVFFNFISNAIKYSPNAEKILVDIKQIDSHVRVAITDYGIGIPKENLGKIFDRFYRAENLSPTFAGLGIGLFIASEIIRRHNGTFGVESEDGKGSTFYFTLPLEDWK